MWNVSSSMRYVGLLSRLVRRKIAMRCKYVSLRVLAGGWASVEEGISLGRFLRDFQGHVVPGAAHGATERARDRRVQSLFTLGWEARQSAQSGTDTGQQTPGQLISRCRQFMPRVAVHKRGLCRPVVRWLGVCLSFTLVYCVETAKVMGIVGMECEEETIHKLSSGTIFQWPWVTSEI